MCWGVTSSVVADRWIFAHFQVCVMHSGFLLCICRYDCLWADVDAVAVALLIFCHHNGPTHRSFSFCTVYSCSSLRGELLSLL